LVFRFLEGERMKDADGAWGKAVTVDRKKVAKTAMTLNLNSTLAPFSPWPFSHSFSAFGRGCWTRNAIGPFHRCFRIFLEFHPLAEGKHGL
jgi:hypothetical protein